MKLQYISIVIVLMCIGYFENVYTQQEEICESLIKMSKYLKKETNTLDLLCDDTDYSIDTYIKRIAALEEVFLYLAIIADILLQNRSLVADSTLGNFFKRLDIDIQSSLRQAVCGIKNIILHKTINNSEISHLIEKKSITSYIRLLDVFKNILWEGTIPQDHLKKSIKLAKYIKYMEYPWYYRIMSEKPNVLLI